MLHRYFNLSLKQTHFLVVLRSRINPHTRTYPLYKLQIIPRNQKKKKIFFNTICDFFPLFSLFLSLNFFFELVARRFAKGFYNFFLHQCLLRSSILLLAKIFNFPLCINFVLLLRSFVVVSFSSINFLLAFFWSEVEKKCRRVI